MDSPRPNRRIKVLYLIDSLGPGGAERLMVDLLPRLRTFDVESEVIAIQERHGNPVAAELESAGIAVSTIGIERLRERGALGRVLRAIEAAEPDVVHTQLEFADILGSVAAHRLGVPSVATIHTLDRPHRWSREAARFRIMAWTLRHRSSRVIAVSDSARRHVLHKAGLAKRHTITIHNGIDLDPFLAVDPTAGQKVRAELGIAAEARVLTTVAVLRELKGIQHMIDAMPAVLASVPDAHYLIVGDGEHGRSLRNCVAEVGVEGSVTFAGSRTDIPDVLAASDLFVLPSLTEALPTVVIEAMAVGVPVVATDVGGTSEIITSGDTGVLIPPSSPGHLEEAVTRVLTSPRQRVAMGAAGRRAAVARFSIDRHASRLADEYRLLARGMGL
jgi:glycosyltransferase involved in cell wall biosynthesis